MPTVSEQIRRHRQQWHYRGQLRPAFAIAPGPGQESVWDYPRPPRIVHDNRRVVVSFDGRTIAESSRAQRVLETASPPTFYLPPEDVAMESLRANATRSLCEWKGTASGFDLVDGPAYVAWRYSDPFPEFQSIAGWIAFYPAKLDCTVDAEVVKAQPGGYYGGWVTAEIVGPFKGEPPCDASY